MSAVPAPDTGPDAGAVWHYGDPLGEQRAAADEAVVVDRSHRAVLAAHRRRTQSWLHSISTQHVSDLPDGAVTENLSLDGQGRVEDHWIQTELDGVTVSRHRIVARRAAADLPAQDGLLGRRRVEPADLAVLSLLGPRLADHAGARGARPDCAARRSGRRSPCPTAVSCAGCERPGRSSSTSWCRATQAAAWLRPADVAAGVRPAGVWAYEAHRVAALRPAARRRHRRAHDPARGRLDRRPGEGRAPGQGLLSRPGDRRAGP